MSGSTTLSTSGQGGYLLPAGYMTTSGSQILDSNGNPVRIDSVGWNGSGGAGGGEPEGLYATSFQTIMDAVKTDGFNTIRIPWSDVELTAMPASGTIDYSQNPSLQGLNTLQIFQQIVAYAGQIGLKIVFDHHTNDGGANGWGGQQANGLWFDSGAGSDGTDGSGNTGTITAAKFQQDSVTLASAFKGNSTVLGYDLDNEPTSAGNIKWGQGGPTDIQAMYTTVGNAVEAADPGALIIAEGPQEYSAPGAGSGMTANVAAPEGDLTGVTTDPVVLNAPNKVVYSVHEYPSTISGTSVDSGTGYIQQMNAAWGYLETQNVAPVWVGEMGASLDGTADSAGSGLADEQAWASTLLGYMNGQDGAQGGPTFTGNNQPIGGDWWLLGSEDGQFPDGIQSAWGVGNYRSGQQGVTNQMLFIPKGTPNPTPTPAPTPAPTPTPTGTASANDTVVTGTTAAITDASGNKWTIVSSGQVAINGIADTTTAGVTELAYVNGAIWQENSNNLWWGETQPNASWAPAAGTATSPLPATATAASPDDTVVQAPSTAGIIDANGNTWTITSANQVALNGVTDTSTAGVLELAYVNGTIWQENTNNLWWGKTLANGSWGPSAGTTSPLPTKPIPAPTPTPTAGPTSTASANDTVVELGSTAAIVDASGNKWTITSTSQVALNGTTDTSTAGVIELAYVDGTIWQGNTNNLWWGKTQADGSWGPPSGVTSPLPATLTPTPTPMPTSTASPDDTVVQLGSTAAIVDASGNEWTITSAGLVAVNGVPDATTAQVTELAYVSKQVWQENSGNLWWGKTSPTAAWAPNAGVATSPLPTTITIAPSQATQTVSLSQIMVVATSGNHMLFITGSNNTVNLTGGTDTITDTGSSNTYVMPAASTGYDTFTSNILATGQTLDLRTALAATNWTGSTSTLTKYLEVVDTAQGAVLSIAPTSGGTGVAIATINGATTATLTSLLAHAIT